MQKPYFLHKLILGSVLFTTLFSCRKENGIDNNNVLETPYGLYASDALGTLYNTNNGDFYKLNFPTDGYPMRAITTSGTNILFIKSNTHISSNNGENFNYAEGAVTKFANWQSMILDLPIVKKLYLAVDSPGAPFPIKVSTDHGVTWSFDNKWDPNLTGVPGYKITSFAALANGILFAHDAANNKLYKRNSDGADWTEVTMAGIPAGGPYYLSHINNVLVLADYTGVNGIWNSTNNGQNWTQYTGLPGRPIYAVSAPFDEVLLVGTDSTGLYKLLGNTFTPANSGMGNYNVVKGITGKENTYKNGVVARYYYVATSNGIYRSGNQGQDWILVKPGNFTKVY